ncbi:MAG: mannose-phosphate guanylyltransferase [Planctomycetota bacterium]|nr:mannose-phosphate guanylyltransferase [Planctomycetota bacterium]
MFHVVVMAGGSGTRFWPKSRRNRPKQLLNLSGEGSLLQQTVERIGRLASPERVWIITGSDQADAVRAQLPGVPAANVVAEPCPRDTAPCVGLAAAILVHQDPDAIMAVMPADHVIAPPELFQKTLQAAISVVESDPTAFVTLGVRPTRPETGYGYIERGKSLGLVDGIAMHQVVQFREKPDRPTAEKFLAEGRFAWNAGIFVWKAQAILDALAIHRPGLAAAIGRVAKTIGTAHEAATIALEFPRMERIPIDKAVMEKATNVRVLEVTYDWSDVGDWRSLAEILPTDDQGNTRQGPVQAIDTKGSILIAADGRLIATLGVEDLVVVQSSDATLVAKIDQLDRLKAMVEGLGEAGFGNFL